MDGYASRPVTRLIYSRRTRPIIALHGSLGILVSLALMLPGLRIIVADVTGDNAQPTKRHTARNAAISVDEPNVFFSRHVLPPIGVVVVVAARSVRSAARRRRLLQYEKTKNYDTKSTRAAVRQALIFFYSAFRRRLNPKPSPSK